MQHFTEVVVTANTAITLTGYTFLFLDFKQKRVRKYYEIYKHKIDITCYSAIYLLCFLILYSTPILNLITCM